MKIKSESPKQSSERRIAASRANGAKSLGPVTVEGKAQSSRNSIKHGLLASLITLTAEDEAVFTDIHERYIARFEPRDQPEHDLVEQIVWANFQMRQAWIQQTGVLGLQIALDKDKVNMEWLSPSEYDRRALALVESIKDSPAIALLQRYSRSLANQAERAIKVLLELRKQRLPPAAPTPSIDPKQELRNEPSPIIEHAEIQPEMSPEAPAAYIRYAPKPVRIATQPASSVPSSPDLAISSRSSQRNGIQRSEHAGVSSGSEPGAHFHQLR